MGLIELSKRLTKVTASSGQKTSRSRPRQKLWAAFLSAQGKVRPSSEKYNPYPASHDASRDLGKNFPNHYDLGSEQLNTACHTVPL